MADNVTAPGTGVPFASRSVTYSGDTVHAPATGLVKFSGSDDAKTVTDVNPASEDKQDTQITAIGIVTETAPATDTASSGLNGRLQRIAQRISSLITALGSPFQAGGSIGNTSFGVSSLPAEGYSAPVTLTRTADTNAYAAQDVIGSATGSSAALTFANMGPSAGRILIIGAELRIDSVGLISGEANYRLHLYNVTPPSALGDNAAFNLPSGDRASYLGYIDLSTPEVFGDTLYAQDASGKQLKLAGTSLFGYLTTIGAYTPTSARVYVITLHAVAV